MKNLEEKKNFEKAFFALEDMETILDCSYDGIWITDGQGKVIYMNSSNEKMLGIKKENIIGKMSQDLLDSKLFQTSAPLEVIKKRKTVSMMGYNFKTQKHVLITGNPIFDKNAEIKYIITNVRDMTQIEESMMEIQEKDQVIKEQRKEIQGLLTLKKQRQEEQGIIVVSKKMEEVMECASRVSRFDSTVLVLGESGVGKEVVVKDIVRCSDRAEKPFVKVNCGAIPENLIESELFGYEKGAFTGADSKGKMGMFELADAGTIFLDEVAELPLALQVKLLRVLQEREVVRVGGVKGIKLDTRVIAATNGNLEKMVETGKFRRDLYYRLNVVSIEIPPLRERVEDIPQLVYYFLSLYCKKYNVNREIGKEILEELVAYNWPGNVRELQNVVENLVVMSNDTKIQLKNLSINLRKKQDPIIDKVIEEESMITLKEALKNTETILIRRAMEKYKSTRKAAKALGVNQSTVVRKMKEIKED